MAARDIMPWGAPLGGHTLTLPFHLLADETFAEGEVVRLENASGQLEEAADDPDITIWNEDTGAVGVAAEPAEGMATDAEGTTNPDFANRGVHMFMYDQLWITPNISVGGSTFADSDLTHDYVGDACGLTLIGTSWGIQLVGTNLQFRIYAILDAARQPIVDGTTAAAYAVFKREELAQYQG